MSSLHDSPGSCSLVIHAPLAEPGAPCGAQLVDVPKKERQGDGERAFWPGDAFTAADLCSFGTT